MANDDAVVDVSNWPLLGVETGGLREHPWLRDPSTGNAWLWKPLDITGPRNQGEDWSERLASRIGQLMGIPCAAVELAERDSRLGCISLDLKPSRWELQPGAVLLSGLLDGYQSRVRWRPGHSLANIERALAGCGTPPNSGLPETFNAFDVFAGYLVFDALIGNRDRHDENWAVLRPPRGSEEPTLLCGTYDHASSLGFNVADEERERRISTGEVASWARRGTAYKFEHSPTSPPKTLVEFARDGLSRCTRGAAGFWTRALENLSDEDILAVVDTTLRLSSAARRFALEVVRINRERILNGER